MTKNLSSSKKILSSLFLLIVCFSAVSTQRAQACVAAWAPSGAGTDTCAPLILIEGITTNVNTSATAISTGADAATNLANTGINVAKLSWDTVGKDALEAIGFTVGKKIVDQLTQNTIGWIKGGFHGDASFAVDLNAIALETADSIAGGMVLSLRNISVCEFSATYKDDLVNSVDLSSKKRPYIYNQKATCPFKESYDFKASDFYGATSQTIVQGSGMVTKNLFDWDKFSLALNDGGNPYGLQLITAQEQADREAEAMATKDKKLSWSNGFTDILDTDDCNYPPGTFYTADDFSVGGTGSMTQADADRKNEEMMKDPARVKALQKAHCKTTTPGAIVSDQLTKTLGLNMDRLGLSDNLNKIFATLIDTLTQKTIRGVFGTKDQSVGKVKSSPVGTRPSVVVTVPVVTNVSQTSAKLTSTITYADPSVRVWFLYGLTEANVIQSIANSNLPTNISKAPTALLDTVLLPAPITSTRILLPFSTTITGLYPETTYYFAVIARVGSPVAGDALFTEVTSFQTDQ